MKMIFAFLTVAFGVNAFALIGNSNLSPRHQDLIEKAVVEKCYVGRGYINELATTVETIKIDQGIIDQRFTTEFEVFIRFEQNMYDRYLITVVSYLASGYDHEAKDWGMYSIESVSDCQLQ